MLPPALERRRDTRTEHCSLHAVEGNTNVEENTNVEGNTKTNIGG